MENKEKIDAENSLVGYIISQTANNIESIEKDIESLKERVNILEKEDKKSRVKIVIFLIILIFTYLTASIPKLMSIIEAIEKSL